ncbi:MAG: LysR family transcriptional regulator [Gammaproteobacteria bacterium]|nr:LysR family transcriptional regulator [Gammaproteobacteria bacterium]MBU1467619.1 LysR family transcriptional regulator [Gammaproteobacteria bacterium]
MNLKQLRYFCEVVSCGSATQAAKHLFIAPTAISMQISQLENHLGGELFDRSTRPMELTALGKYFYPRAKDLLAQMTKLDEETHDIATGKSGCLSIGVVRSTLFTIMPQAIRAFREAYPGVHLDLLEVLSEYQPDLLVDRRIHIGISRFIGKFSPPDHQTHTLIMEDPFVVAIPAHHPLAEKKSLIPKDIDKEPFIIYPKDPVTRYGEKILDALATKDSKPEVSYEAIEIHTALSLVSAGLGVTLVAQSISKNHFKDVVFIPIEGLETSTSIVAVTNTREHNIHVDAFLSFLKP